MIRKFATFNFHSLKYISKSLLIGLEFSENCDSARLFNNIFQNLDAQNSALILEFALQMSNV